jgi:hypothetical protein
MFRIHVAKEICITHSAPFAQGHSISNYVSNDWVRKVVRVHLKIARCSFMIGAQDTLTLSTYVFSEARQRRRRVL